MKRKCLNKKWIITILCALTLLMAMPVCASAAVGSNGKGASIPRYKKVKTIQIDGDNFWNEFTSAMEEAAKKASSSCQYKIVIPPGDYPYRRTVILGSHTWIYAKGATFRLEDTTAAIFRTETGKSGYQNIRIDGGVWDGSKQSSWANDKVMFRAAHVKNMVLNDMTLKCRRNNHMIEVSDTNGLTISNCRLSGNNLYMQVQPKEAIQLDVATQSGMNGYTPYNGKGCHNVLISGCTFTNVSRGLGSHSYANGTEKNPYTDITVKNNTFNNSAGSAIHCLSWKKCSILGNKIYNAHYAGIYMEACSLDKIASNTIKTVRAYSGQRKKTYGGQRAGILLRSVSNSSLTGNRASGCSYIIQKQLSCPRNTIKNNKKK